MPVYYAAVLLWAGGPAVQFSCHLQGTASTPPKRVLSSSPSTQLSTHTAHPWTRSNDFTLLIYKMKSVVWRKKRKISELLSTTHTWMWSVLCRGQVSLLRHNPRHLIGLRTRRSRHQILHRLAAALRINLREVCLGAQSTNFSTFTKLAFWFFFPRNSDNQHTLRRSSTPTFTLQSHIMSSRQTLFFLFFSLQIFWESLYS